MKRGPSNISSPRNTKKLKQDNGNDSFLQPLNQEQLFLNAASIGDIQTFNSLLDCVDINCTSFINETALMLAISHAPEPNKFYIVTCLINYGADINVASIWGDTALSIAKKLHLHDIVSQLEYRNLSHLNLPNEIWIEIAKYLSPEDLGNFRLICESLNKLHNNNTDLLWQPFLNRLHTIDKTVSITPQPGKTIRESFIDEFLRVKKTQFDDLAILTGNNHDEMHKLKTYFDPSIPTTLEILEKRHDKLVELNCVTIQQNIDEQPGYMLIIEDMPITEFPKEIMEGRNKAYFSNLQTLVIKSGHLRTLPSNIDICENLEHLHCCDNQVTKLPKSIMNLKKLQTLCCHNNCLTELPEGICELTDLTEIDCNSNRITHLPNKIGNLAKIQRLYIVDNNINALPESMIYIIEKLLDYEFAHNPFHNVDENSFDDNIENAYFISFMNAQIPSVEPPLEHTIIDNKPSIWEPLSDELRMVFPSFMLRTDTNQSLRDQFVDGFQTMGKMQLAWLSENVETDLLSTFDIIKNPTTGELSFKYLTLDKMILNQEEINKMLSSFQIQAQSPGLFFQSDSIFDNGWPNAENNDDFDFDDPEEKIRWRM